MFSYPFLVRAVLVGALVSLCCALLGVSLVLKRYSMIGDGLSHVGFGALALATALNAAPLTVAIPVVVAAAFGLLRLSENSRIRGDAAIALISTASLAVGVMIVSQTTGMNTDVCNYLFGSILAMSRADVYLSVGLTAVMLVLFILFYHKLFAITFDETFARAGGIKTGLYNMLIAFLTAVTIVLGMRMMGAMLISSLIIFPALSSMRLFKRFSAVTLCSAAVSLVCFFIGVIISYVYATPTGASVVIVNVLVFLLFWGVNLALRGRKSPKALLTALAAGVLFLGCGRINEFTVPRNAGGTAAAALPESYDGEFTELGFSRPPMNAEGGVIEIREKLFIAQTNDVYLNPKDYLGKTLKLEGLFQQVQAGETGYCYVLRYGPGCCGNDGNAGFEVAWDPPLEQPYPGENDWVEAVGTLKTYLEDGYPYLYLSLSSLRALDTRGAEFVTQ
jgi:zinc transport system permease protein